MDDTMRAVVISRYGGALEVADRPVPRPGPGEVLIRVRASGLCSTDLHLLSGRMPLGDLPRVVGHESAGDLVELGEGVTGWAVGDRVTVPLDVVCGECRHCRTGHTQRCRRMVRIGFERDGGHARYLAVPAANVIALPPTLAYDEAAILPDAVASMYHALICQGKVGVGQNVLIHGAGGLGIHGVQIARLAGADVIATSRRAQRLRIAEEHGAIPVNTASESPKRVVDELTRGEGLDVVVDNIGTRASVREGLGLLRPGGKLLAVAYVDEAYEVPSIPLFKTEQQVIGCRGSSKQDLVEVVRLVGSGRLKPIIGAHYPLEDIDAAVERLEGGDLVGRLVLTRD
jgi:2-desacetyl-2-hydroxyethyl bacteriochlorophyllide A dehydrogenase